MDLTQIIYFNFATINTGLIGNNTKAISIFA
ncbi:uncharacterized protein METZ01_LOCUS21125 [marine metagenome]|uniref:Uncharacterized protein n=1 Tax=marine metagenome TaxID=408172 RepID=A0A381PMM3_9ZZZZ